MREKEDDGDGQAELGFRPPSLVSTNPPLIIVLAVQLFHNDTHSDTIYQRRI